MPVDPRDLPEKIAPPLPPGKWRWCLVVLLCSALGGGLVALLWPADMSRMSPWFWCCVVVFPLMTGLSLFAMRLSTYERQRDFAQSWNQRHSEQEQVLIGRGQQKLAVLATSYCSPAGNNKLAQTLRNGSRPLQPVYLERLAMTLRVSQLTPQAQRDSVQEYAERLTAYCSQVMRTIEEDLQHLAGTTPVRIRIKHNQVLGDDNVLSLWQSTAMDTLVIEQVVHAKHDDGLLWLDAWLDEGEPAQLLLSLEINLFQKPIAEQAESVSAVLFAHPDYSAKRKLAPTAWVHRPVRIAGGNGLGDALLWGKLHEEPTQYFVWQTQLPSDFSGDVSVAMSAAGYALDTDKCQRLDDSFGLPASAVGNIALVIASEQARADSQPQLVMLQDVSPQCCIVRPAE
ncbi:hypothetical protein D3C76_618910 [compost metagenome]